MSKVTVNQDALLSIVANFHSFIVVGLYDNGMILQESRGKKAKDSEQARMYQLHASLATLGLKPTVTRLNDAKVEVKLA